MRLKLWVSYEELVFIFPDDIAGDGPNDSDRPTSSGEVPDPGIFTCRIWIIYLTTYLLEKYIPSKYRSISELSK